MATKLVSRMCGVLTVVLLCLGVIAPMALADDLQDISGATVSASNATYTGVAITPAVTVTLNGATLSASTDYTVAYASNKDAGTATVTVSGKGDYTGTATGSFTISPASASKLTIGEAGPKVYTGEPRTVSPVVMFGNTKLKKNRDYTLSFENNVHAGKAKVIVTGQGNFTGQKSAKFVIQKAPLTKVKVSKIAKKTYTGSAITPNPTITYKGTKLKKGIDYRLVYKSNKNAGKAQVVVKGIKGGNFTGKKYVTFTIKRAPVKNAKASSISDQKYTGSPIKPTPKLTFKGKKMKKGRDYTLSYSSNKNAGTAKVIVKGKGNFTGKKTLTFKILTVPITDATFKPINAKPYTGDLVRPDPKITYKGKRLKVGTDYTLSYDNNEYVGTAYVTVTAKGNFTGSKTVSFALVARSVAKAKFSDIMPQAYTGHPIEPNPAVTVKGRRLVQGTDYTLSYADNVNAGSQAKVYIHGRGNYTGDAVAYFRIV